MLKSFLRSRSAPARAIRAAVGAAALAALAVPVAASGSAFPGTNGRIVFVHETPSTGATTTSSIETANPDGSGIQQVTSGHNDAAPRFSADGKSIVFTRYGFPSTAPGGNASHVMIVNADGTGLRDLSGSGLDSTPDSDETPSFSPDGTHIVFSRLDYSTEQFTGIYEEAVTGGATTRITTADDTMPTFSPDGTKIAFVRESDTGSAIYTVPPVILAGATQITHPPTDNYDLNPDWSPDGKKIAFDRDSLIYVTNSDGSGTATALTSRTTPSTADRVPSFSPDGTKIVFQHAHGVVGPGSSEAFGLYVMNANGTSMTAVAGLDGSATQSNEHPDWAPGAAATKPPSGGGTQPPPPTSGCGSSSEPDRNGDLHSHCHTGAKGRGAGGNDKSGKH